MVPTGHSPAEVLSRPGCCCFHTTPSGPRPCINAIAMITSDFTVVSPAAFPQPSSPAMSQCEVTATMQGDIPGSIISPGEESVRAEPSTVPAPPARGPPGPGPSMKKTPFCLPSLKKRSAVADGGNCREHPYRVSRVACHRAAPPKSRSGPGAHLAGAEVSNMLL